MPKYIDADALRKRMYHDAFETDSNLQRCFWDSGCWIRYKVFENALADAPTIDAVEVGRCKDCKHLSDVKIAPKWNRVCRLIGCGKALDGFCDEWERREDA